MKSRRQNKILELIRTEVIETQDELLERLQSFGFQATQATISRDIKDMRLVKTQTAEGMYKYSDGGEAAPASSLRLRTIFREAVTHMDRAQNLVVIKTMPGMANAACAALDAMQKNGVVGTLAGDDTAFIAMRDNGAALTLLKQLQDLLD